MANIEERSSISEAQKKEEVAAGKNVVILGSGFHFVSSSTATIVVPKGRTA